METKLTELPDSRVKVDVDVDPSDVDSSLKKVAGSLGKEMKIPGFRKGKVPAEMVVQKMGREAVLSQAIEGSIGDWYERAMLESGVSPVGDPRVDLQELPEEGKPLQFTIEVAVRPPAELGDYKGLEVARVEPEVPEEAIDAELERLRKAFAKLTPVERTAAEGDVALIDFEGTIDGEPFPGGEARDHMLELGAGRVLPEFEAAVIGASSGEERKATVAFPDEYQSGEVAGKTAEFAIKVNEVRERALPDLDDDFAAEASEFETLAELRERIADGLREYLEQESAERFREAALDAAVGTASFNVPQAVVDARAGQMWQRLERNLRKQGMEPDEFLKSQGKTREQLLEEGRPDAELALKREAVLEAVADAEEIEVSEEDLLDALRPPPGHEDHDHPAPEEALAELRKTGRDKMLREDLRMRRALEVIAEEAKPIAPEKAEAKEEIWTPDKEQEKKQLWTPGSGPAKE